MANLNLSFSLEKNHGLVLRITERGKSNGSRVTVKNLLNPEFTTWDKKEQKFMGKGKEVAHNNLVLKKMMQSYRTALKSDAYNYITLLHKLEAEGKIIKEQLRDVIQLKN